MFDSKKLILAILLFNSLLSTMILSQEVGKIFDKNEADELYGPVIEKKVISAVDLELLLLSTNDKIMFRLENNIHTILGDERKLLYCSDKFVESKQIFYMYSKTKVIELHIGGSVESVTLAQRKDVFSITAGNYTLEDSMPCPPYCN